MALMACQNSNSNLNVLSMMNHGPQSFFFQQHFFTEWAQIGGGLVFASGRDVKHFHQQHNSEVKRNTGVVIA